MVGAADNIEAVRGKMERQGMSRFGRSESFSSWLPVAQGPGTAKSHAADREIDDVFTVPRSRPA